MKLTRRSGVQFIMRRCSKAAAHHASDKASLWNRFSAGLEHSGATEDPVIAAPNIRGWPLKQEFGLVYRSQRMSPAARAFIEFCKRNKQLLPETTGVAGS